MIKIKGTFVTERGLIEKMTRVIEDDGHTSAEYEYGDDCLIFPSFVDIHVHAREDLSQKHIYKEDFLSVSNAAINGGVSMIAEMPNNPIPPIDDKSYEEKLKLTKTSKIPILLYAAITPNSTPLSKEVPYKIYLGPSIGDNHFKNYEEIERKIALYHGKSVSFHCEAPEVMDKFKHEKEHHQRRPPEAEIESIKRAIELIKKYSLRGKICHVSTCGGIELINKAKKSGVNITAEVSFTHLYFSTDNMDQMRRHYMQMNPPIRTEVERQGLLEYVKKGSFDFLATDHAPHSLGEKEKGISGLTALDQYGSMVYWLYEQGVTLPLLIKISSTNPRAWISEFMPLQDRSDFTVLKRQEIRVTTENLKTKCGHSPYLDQTLSASVHQIFISGKPLKNDL